MGCWGFRKSAGDTFTAYRASAVLAHHSSCFRLSIADVATVVARNGTAVACSGTEVRADISLVTRSEWVCLILQDVPRAMYDIIACPQKTFWGLSCQACCLCKSSGPQIALMLHLQVVLIRLNC